MSQSIKNFVHPSVARARREAALECARIAAHVAAEAGDAGYPHTIGIRSGAKAVEERIRQRFGLDCADENMPSVEEIF